MKQKALNVDETNEMLSSQLRLLDEGKASADTVRAAADSARTLLRLALGQVIYANHTKRKVKIPFFENGNHSA